MGCPSYARSRYGLEVAKIPAWLNPIIICVSYAPTGKIGY